jgi:hypothetical protein
MIESCSCECVRIASFIADICDGSRLSIRISEPICASLVVLSFINVPGENSSWRGDIYFRHTSVVPAFNRSLQTMKKNGSTMQR